MTDRILVQCAKLGSRKAADELFERYYREIYAYIFKQCRDKELAMDLTQDTFVAAFRGIRSFNENKSGFRTWLYRVASNKITDYYRSRIFHRRSFDISLDETPEFSDDTDILEQLTERDTVRQIMEIISQFDAERIRIFRKKIFEEQTFSQIAQDLSLPESTIKTRYYSMIRKIKKELSQ